MERGPETETQRGVGGKGRGALLRPSVRCQPLLSARTYNSLSGAGTVTLCRKKPLSVKMGIGAKEHDEEGRVVRGCAPCRAVLPLLRRRRRTPSAPFSCPFQIYNV